MDNIRILICDDHALLRSGIIGLLDNEPGIFVIGETENGNELIDTHRGNIMHKFELKNTVALVRFAFLYTESKRTNIINN